MLHPGTTPLVALLDPTSQGLRCFFREWQDTPPRVETGSGDPVFATSRRTFSIGVSPIKDISPQRVSLCRLKLCMEGPGQLSLSLSGLGMGVCTLRRLSRASSCMPRRCGDSLSESSLVLGFSFWLSHGSRRFYGFFQVLWFARLSYAVRWRWTDALLQPTPSATWQERKGPYWSSEDVSKRNWVTTTWLWVKTNVTILG